jgi:hydrogenase expression/formation protein HypC
VCLGIPGRIIAFDDSHDHLARVEVMGATRTVNIALVQDEGVAVGDWVLLHLGFVMEILDEEGAAVAKEGLELMGREDPGAGAAAESTLP